MRLLLATIFIFVSSKVLGQASDFPPVNLPYFMAPTPDIGHDKTALVIAEVGKTQLEIVESEHALLVVHDYKARIKILKKEGVDQANFEIPLYAFGNTLEKAVEIKGKTYNIKDNRITETEMQSKAIFLDKVSPYRHTARFTLPQVEEGSIIDIQYRILSPDILNFRSWQFQQDIPKLYSAYTAIMPATYQYQVTLRGPYPLKDTKSELLREYFLLNGVRNDCSKITYTMADIPAFEEEDFMLAAKNYKSAISFELEQYYLTNGSKVRVTKEWRDVDRELLNEKSFGGQLKKEDVFADVLPSILKDKINVEEKARAIYSYIQKNIKWNDVYGKYAQFGVRESLAQHRGNTGDINLALITALNAAGIPAYPVLVSTRQNGIPNNLHPVISDFNYVVGGAEIGNKTVLLDATDPFTAFGELPLRCVNERGRIIYSKKSSEWIPLVNEQPALTTFTLLGTIDSTENIVGKLSISYKGLDALRKRHEISSFNTEEEYLEELALTMSNMGLQNGSLSHVHDIDEFLIEQFDIKLTLSDFLQDGILRFNPIFLNRITKNPFNLNERLYQVDLGAKRHVTHHVNLELPASYDVKSLPKNMNMKLPEDAARYSYQTTLDNRHLIFKQIVSLNKPIYSVDEYFHLKEFYSRIIQQQQLEFELKKLP
ncbi:DUF3857 domain-containing protein [Sphingobacterium griseoflavum]|uniref:DUF3857 domain-containing protein n=1 Tax=Sphingobacterium griseoflavum TaxID=1474952 RepID=A0ABQ3I1B3_9SPHI|nr:DUF3857 domain-containing protein [Sphingobacterium griseoflavum]GHE48592.1 hypothetical protein GCM10017764_34510 [Sphingobacterium griseoflavum]